LAKNLYISNMTLTQTFLKAKHWHLCLLTFGIPMIAEIALIIAMFADISKGVPPDPTIMFSFFKFFPVLMIVCLGSHYCWQWSIAIGLLEKIPANAKMKTGTFKLFFFIPMVYILLISIGVGLAFNGLPEMIERNVQPDFGMIATSMAIVIPLHLFSMFCIFYCLYFVSKTFKTAELQRQTTFSDFAGEFFLLWFYPVGIWIVQPKINKMVESTPELPVL
jgi:hypothetical protein